MSGFLNPDTVPAAFDRDIAGIEHLVSGFGEKLLKRFEWLLLPLLKHCRRPAHEELHYVHLDDLEDFLGDRMLGMDDAGLRTF